MLQALETSILFATVLLAPIAFGTISQDSFGLLKLLILTFGALAILFIRSLIGMIRGYWEYPSSKIHLSIIFISFIYLFITIIFFPNKMGLFFVPGMATIVLSGAFLFLLINRLDQKERLPLVFLASAVTASTILVITAIKQVPLALFDTSLATILFWAVGLGIAIREIPKQRDIPMKVLFGAICVVIAFGIAYTISEVKLSALSITPNVPSVIAVVTLLVTFTNMRIKRIELPKMVFLFPAAISVVLAVLLGVATNAEYTFQLASDTLRSQKEEESYALLQQAINSNPYVDRYHVAYAQLNMVIADDLAKKEPMSQEQRSMISKLREQAINEGKKAVYLDPKKATNWQALGQFYEALPPTVDSERFSVQAYSQAVRLDPTNEAFRRDLSRAKQALSLLENP